MRLLLVSDAWMPQVNGVVTCMRQLQRELERQGHQVLVIHPGLFRTLPCPGYGEIRLAWNVWRVPRMIRQFAPDAVHLATEGPLGWAARAYLRRRGYRFSSAVHTRFPEYIHQRWPWIPLHWGYAYLRAFHHGSSAVQVSTQRMLEVLQGYGLVNLKLWRKGVDLSHFTAPPVPQSSADTPRFVYVGRLAAEKNLEAFLSLALPGSKRVVGDGPERARLEAAFTEVEFVGYRHGAELAKEYQAASVLVFPSRTDTFGLVMLEALACGTPVAAFPVPGPLDVLNPACGVMDEDLQQACLRALTLDRQACVQAAQAFSWQRSAQECVAAWPTLKADWVALPPQALTPAA
ncbi:Glycosyltransferase involved in cell wall bisynthesis [Atopomonas hussainii]|uniref:Glycosyltransferase involved in cell wall bisynthesis n=1 Tax=Atopomonas hussainii TaxID=1429083 RepID=A0A1H7RMS0_9GAMM|nr:glycosyltransferase family 1 protein [Atopomonas hussainii]SEL61493.1 Glycosyltransferase involved in cell wall bisynthesis [Atopomonas hussainii]